MPIKFKCPHCGKPLSVKEQLAGKKAKCPNASCGQAIVIPAAVPAMSTVPAPTQPVAPPNPGVVAAVPPPAVDGVAAKPPESADAEALAASMLSDEPAPVDTAPPKTLKFNCSYCDEVVQVDVALAGKQAPCPECRRIIKIPHLQEQKKTDWRNANTALPSGARRDLEPAPEGAWGSTAVARVSAEALEEADALPEDREPVSIRQWITRGVLAASVVAVLVFGTLWVLNRLAKDKKQAAYDMAMAELSAVKGYPAAVVHLAAGTYHVRRNEKDCIKDDQADDNAWQQFGSARAILAAGPDARSPECDALLIELALAQFDLVGNDDDVSEGKRLTWKETRKEIVQTLRQIRNVPIRTQGMRMVLRKLIDRGQAAEAVEVAKDLADSLELLAVAVIELQLAGEQGHASSWAGSVLVMLDRAAPPGQPLLVPSVEAQAVLILKGPREKANVLGARMSKDDREVAEVVALLAGGKAAEAHDKALDKNKTAEAQFRSLVELADAPGAKSASKAATEEALNFAQAQSRALPTLPALTTYRLIDAGVRNGIDATQLRPLIERVQKEERLRPWMQLQLFRHVLNNASDTVEEGKLSEIERGTLSQSLARVALARHNTRKDADYIKQIDDWDEAVRAFGYIGAALGLQDE